MDQLANWEANSAQFLLDEKLRQDRLLEERRKARLKRKQMSALAVKQRQLEEMTESELTINEHKLEDELAGIDQRLTKALEQQVRKFAR